MEILCRFKFDDERVTKEETKRALEEQYGGEEEVTHYTWLICLQLTFFYFILTNFVLFSLKVATNESWLQQHTI